MPPKGQYLPLELYQPLCFQIDSICLEHNIDQSHGLQHAQLIGRYTALALDQCPLQLPSTTQQSVILAGLLHDMDDHKYFPTHNSYENARRIMAKLTGLDLGQEMVVRMIDLVSYSKNGDQVDKDLEEYYYYARYADRIDAIGLVGLHRCYAYGKHKNNPLFTAATPRPVTHQQLEQTIEGRDEAYRQRGGTSESIIDHLFDKLLHIKLPPNIKNPYLQRQYAHNIAYIKDFVLEHSHDNYARFQEDLLHRYNQSQQMM